MHKWTDWIERAKQWLRGVFAKAPYEPDGGLCEEIDEALSDGYEPDEAQYQGDVEYDEYEPACTDGEAIAPRKVEQHVLNEVNDALRQWQEATTYFESVSDPDLVDFAIYDMEASRRKYVYLVKRTRSERYAAGGIDVGGGIDAAGGA